MTEEQIKELETQAFSKGMHQGILAGIQLVLNHYNKNKKIGTKNLIAFCESEYNRISKMNPIQGE